MRKIAANGQTATLYLGDSLEVLNSLPDNSVDSVVTDPPYELGFMGRKWDATGIAFRPEIWQKCFRVLKPGGHLLAFGAPRNYHRLAVAIEDAGFEIRDSLLWLFGSGFPKALDVSKAIDKALGQEREVIGSMADIHERYNTPRNCNFGTFVGLASNKPGEIPPITKAGSPEAAQWEGWKTALKPAYEPIVLSRKPLDGTVAKNTLKWGVGGLNIDGCRIDYGGSEDLYRKPSGNEHIAAVKLNNSATAGSMNDDYLKGRFPANVLIDEEAGKMIDEQSNDFEGSSRFFYTSKAHSSDRNAGLDGFEERRIDNNEDSDLVGRNNPRNRSNLLRKNIHPTVKPTDLMQYLVRLITPKGGIVLDPFLGSGSTGKAALLEQCNFIGIEREEEYYEIACGRIKFLNPFI